MSFQAIMIQSIVITMPRDANLQRSIIRVNILEQNATSKFYLNPDRFFAKGFAE